MNNRQRSIAGYTLLELIIAIVIMAIVAGSVVQVQYSSNSDRTTSLRVLKSILEQCREVAIAHNAFVKVELKDEKLKVKVEDSDGGALEIADLAVILSAAPSSMSEFEVELSRFAPQLTGVKVSGQLTDGSNQKDFKFIETGALNNGEDVVINIDADHFNGQVQLLVHGFTGLIEVR